MLLCFLQDDVRLVISAFGQKAIPASLNIGQLADVRGVEEVYIHVGVDLHPAQSRETLLWSRAGLESMCTGRGDLYPSLSFKACANLVVRAEGQVDEMLAS